MSCAIRIFNHVPRVRMAQRYRVDRYGSRMRVYPVEALVCHHGTAHPISDLEWSVACLLNIGASELPLFADNDENAFDWVTQA